MQIFGGANNNIFAPAPNNNVNIFGGTPGAGAGGGVDLIGTFTEVVSLTKNLNNLLNGLQNLYNQKFNGFYNKITNAAPGQQQQHGFFKGNGIGGIAMRPYFYGSDNQMTPNPMFFKNPMTTFNNNWSPTLPNFNPNMLQYFNPLSTQ